MEYGHLKYSIIYYFSIIMFIFSLICFFIYTLHCYLISNLKIEENNPAIMPTLYKFSFDHSSIKNPEYDNTLPNLGYTGEIIHNLLYW